MAKLECFSGKTTNWGGLWWHPEHNGFSSEAIDLSLLRNFKGKVRLYVRKNKNFNGGENGRPNYSFCIKDTKSKTFKVLDVEDEENEEVEERLYTREEVLRVMRGACEDGRNGSDPFDLLIEDYVPPRD